MSGRFRLMLATLAVALLTLFGCTEGANLPPLQTSQNEELNYHLGPGDDLDIKVLGAENLSGAYTVADNGTISFPLIGNVKAAGLTRAQVERELAQQLRDGYVRDPRVSVSVTKYRPFYIYGEVTKPGKYDYAPGMNVFGAVSVANGFTARANTSFVVISRDGKDRKAVGKTPVLPDDIIKVPERYF